MKKKIVKNFYIFLKAEILAHFKTKSKIFLYLPKQKLLKRICYIHIKQKFLKHLPLKNNFKSILKKFCQWLLTKNISQSFNIFFYT